MGQFNTDHKDKFAEYNEKVKKVASLLPGTWAFLPEYQDHLIKENWFHCFKSRLASGNMKIDIEVNNQRPKWDPDRFCVSGEYFSPIPNRIPTVYRSEDKPPFIRVTASKTAEQIARDIIRRFLPDYERVFKAVLERETRELFHANAQLNNLQTVGALFGMKPTEKDKYLYVSNHFPNEKIYVHRIEAYGNDRVKFEIQAPVDLAIKILKILKEG